MADKEEKEKKAPKEEPKESKEDPKDEKKDRTKKQFDKLTKSNKELKEKVTEYESVIDSLKPKAPTRDKQPTTGKGMGPGLSTHSAPKPKATKDVPQAQEFSHLNQDQIDDMFSGMMDERGYVDASKLVAGLKAMNQRAREAERRAARAEEKMTQTMRQQRDFEESREVREVHKKYPQVDPKSEDFDPELFDAVRNELIGQMMDGKRDFMAATEKWYEKLHGKEEKVATKKEKEEAEKKEDAKAQINATQPKPTSSYQKNYQDLEHEKLVEGTIKGEKGALAERLRRSGHGPKG